MICFPLDNTEYTADALGSWFATRTRGVFAGDGHFEVKPNSGMNITVTPGLAWLKAETYWGVSVLETEPTSLTLDIGDGVYARTDTVCLRLNKVTNKAEMIIKKGFPGTTSIDVPVRDASFDEIYLATIMVSAGATTIRDSDITDQRLNDAYCGVMRDGVTAIPTQTLYNQFTDWAKVQEEAFSDWSETQKREFTEWVDTVKNIFDDSTAGRVFEEIEKTNLQMFKNLYGLCIKETNISSDDSGVTTQISESDTEQNITAVTVFERNESGDTTKIITTVTPDSGAYKYVKTTTFVPVGNNKTIRETYTRIIK